MSYDKGLSLEQVVPDLFKKNGYTVVHNVKKKGRSGVEHQIDVWAEYRAPLHTSVIIIEAKPYQEQIDTDRIMKFIQIVDDLRVDRGIFVTTGDFTPDALMTVEQHNNIELWNRDKLVKLVGQLQISSSEQGVVKKIQSEIKMVAPRISSQQAEQYATEQIKKKTKGGLFGSGKVMEKLQSIKLILYPYYDLKIRATVRQTEKTGLLSKKEVEKIIQCEISLDAVTGELVDVTNKGLSYRYAILSGLMDEQAKLLRFLGGKKDFDVRTVMELGYGESKAREIIDGLLGRGIVEASQTARLPAYYTVRVEYPHDPSKLNSLSGLFPINDYTEQTGRVIEPRIEPAAVSKAIENYWEAVKVDEITSVYYPFYEIWYEREDGSNKLEATDGISGTLNEHIARMLGR